ncbi:MAG: hypothetical protein ACRC62_14985 [Microcoleus sp.]
MCDKSKGEVRSQSLDFRYGRSPSMLKSPSNKTMRDRVATGDWQNACSATISVFTQC